MVVILLLPSVVVRMPATPAGVQLKGSCRWDAFIFDAELRNVSGDRDTPRALTDRAFEDFITLLLLHMLLCG